MERIITMTLLTIITIFVMGYISIHRNTILQLETQLEKCNIRVEDLRAHTQELVALSKHIQQPTVCIDVEDMTAREFLWHMRKQLKHLDCTVVE